MIGSSGSNLAIGISLIIRDQFSGRARQAGQELDRLQQRSQRAQMESARNVNAIGAATGVAALMGMREWVQVGAEFGKQMTYMYSISEKKQGYSLDKMKKKAMEVGANTMFSTTEVGKSMVTMAQAGQNVEQIYRNINSTAVLAAATMSDIHSSASTMNDIMIGFNIPATEQNSMRVADIITKSINDSNIQLADFGESMKYIIPTATSLGVSLEEVAAMISTIGNAGIKGSMAGTNLENLMRYLARATGAEGGSKQYEALSMLGLQPSDLMAANGQMKSMSQIIPMIGNQLQNMSKNNVKGYNAMMDILGVRGGRAGNLLAQNMGTYDKFLSGVNNSQGAAQKTADDVMGSLWGTNEQLASTWENLKIVLTEAIEPVLVPLIKGLTWFINLLRQAVQTPIGKFLTILAAGFIAIRTGVMGYRAVVLSLRLMHSTLGSGFMGTAARITGGYNQMTAAAQRYNAVAGMGGAMGGMGGYAAGRYGPMGMMGPATNMRMMQMMGYGRNSRLGVNAAGRYYNKANGRLISNAVGERYMAATYGRGVGLMGAGSNLAKFGKFAGRASPYAMIGGMALQMGSSAVGEETGLGRGMNVAGSALGWAGTGAMLGSVVPGIGTAAGAIIGGVGGLLYGLYDDMKNEEARLKAAKDQADALKMDNQGFDPVQWKYNAQKYLSMAPGETSYSKGFGGGSMMPTSRAGANMWLQNGGVYSHPKTPNRITINIDGKQAMDKTVNDSNYETFVNLGF